MQSTECRALVGGVVIPLLVDVLKSQFVQAEFARRSAWFLGGGCSRLSFFVFQPQLLPASFPLELLHLASGKGPRALYAQSTSDGRAKVAISRVIEALLIVSIV